MKEKYFYLAMGLMFLFVGFLIEDQNEWLPNTLLGGICLGMWLRHQLDGR